MAVPGLFDEFAAAFRDSTESRRRYLSSPEVPENPFEMYLDRREYKQDCRRKPERWDPRLMQIWRKQ
jgi:hypothetical protein